MSRFDRVLPLVYKNNFFFFAVSASSLVIKPSSVILFKTKSFLFSSSFDVCRKENSKLALLSDWQDKMPQPNQYRRRFYQKNYDWRTQFHNYFRHKGLRSNKVPKFYLWKVFFYFKRQNYFFYFSSKCFVRCKKGVFYQLLADC